MLKVWVVRTYWGNYVIATFSKCPQPGWLFKCGDPDYRSYKAGFFGANQYEICAHYGKALFGKMKVGEVKRFTLSAKVLKK